MEKIIVLFFLLISFSNAFAGIEDTAWEFCKRKASVVAEEKTNEAISLSNDSNALGMYAMQQMDKGYLIVDQQAALNRFITEGKAQVQKTYDDCVSEQNSYKEHLEKLKTIGIPDVLESYCANSIEYKEHAECIKGNAVAYIVRENILPENNDGSDFPIINDNAVCSALSGLDQKACIAKTSELSPALHSLWKRLPEKFRKDCQVNTYSVMADCVATKIEDAWWNGDILTPVTK